MKQRSVTLFVTAMCVLALGLVLVTDWSQLALLAPSHYWGIGILALVALVSEERALSIKIAGVSGGTSIGFLPLFTLVLLFGPAATVGTMVVVGAVVEYLIRQKPPLRANFNIAQWAVSTALGGLAFSAAGGTPLMLMTESVRTGAVLAQFGPFVLFGVVVLWVNNASVAMAIALNQRVPYREVWGRLAGRSGANIVYDVLIAPIAVAVAALYVQTGPLGLLLAILPLFFVRHSYQVAHQLQLANLDLLRALVKAIETRDPYTSGHSLRVSQLARQLAESLALSPRAVEQIETAALLHDVGKIESVYTGILRKPAGLTQEEKAVIESHVTKGEELLRNLASVPEEVIHAVRHHHEREDGAGYPDGLRGTDIPIGAKIIIVCDSVDAMLSDRPYRKALTFTQVLSELRHFAGRQFDSQVVSRLLEGNLLSDYAELMRADHGSDLAPVDPFNYVRPERRWRLGGAIQGAHPTH